MIAFVLASVIAALEIPAYDNHVVDTAGLLDAQSRAQLEQKLRTYERESGPQLAVLIVPETGETSIEEYASRVFEAWRLGHAGKDDGLLVVVATRARAMRIEVGDGLEGLVTDAHSSRIIRNVITPAFRAQHYAVGLDQAIDELTRAISGNTVPTEAVTVRVAESPEEPFDWMTILVPLTMTVLIFVPATLARLRAKPARARRKAGLPLNAFDRWVLKPSRSRGSSSSTSSWSSSSSRSSSSSFSGGGGGRSSGGGASGSW